MQVECARRLQANSPNQIQARSRRASLDRLINQESPPWEPNRRLYRRRHAQYPVGRNEQKSERRNRVHTPNHQQSGSVLLTETALIALQPTPYFHSDLHCIHNCPKFGGKDEHHGCRISVILRYSLLDAMICADTNCLMHASRIRMLVFASDEKIRVAHSHRADSYLCVELYSINSIKIEDAYRCLPENLYVLLCKTYQISVQQLQQIHSFL